LARLHRGFPRSELGVDREQVVEAATPPSSSLYEIVSLPIR
jgi:hypothetical protein